MNQSADIREFAGRGRHRSVTSSRSPQRTFSSCRVEAFGPLFSREQRPASG
jgi:hypothetical protein